MLVVFVVFTELVSGQLISPHCIYLYKVLICIMLYMIFLCVGEYGSVLYSAYISCLLTSP